MTDERRAELLASADLKRRNAQIRWHLDAKGVQWSRILVDGIWRYYTITYDEYEAMFDPPTADELRFWL